MKLRFVFFATVVVLLTLAACREPGLGPYRISDSAALTGLSITSADDNGEVTVSAARIPGGIDQAAYDDYDDEFGMTLQPWETITLKLEEHYVDARINPKAARGATVEVGFGDRATRPAYYVDARALVTFEPNQYIYLRVTSEDGTKVMYYRFYAPRLSVVTNLADVFIQGKRQEILDGGDTWFNATEGVIDLTRTQAAGVNIDVVGFDATSTFKFARVPNEYGLKQPLTAPETYQESNRFTTFEDQDYLYIEVTAQNGKDRQYYCFLITVGRIINIAKLEMIPAAPVGDAVEVLGIGFSAPVWNDVRLGSFSTAEQTPTFTIKITPQDSDATCTYAKTPSSPGTAPVTYQATGNLTFADNDLLAIKVVSGNGNVTAYYKVKVSLLAGVFLEHPKSAYYYYYHKKPDNYADVVDATGGPVGGDTEDPTFVEYRDDYYSPTLFTSDEPVNLSVKLAKALPAGSTYQWYEANSWYGGYGFDAYDHFNHPNNTQTGLPDTDFQEDRWHQKNFDEKLNVSLFNGGNQSARYLFPGIKLGDYKPAQDTAYMAEGKGTLGTASDTIPGPKPKLHWRPLLKGTSSHSHYYWVEITDSSNGRKATSQRAVIVSERNKAINHFIIDVNNTPVQGKMGVDGAWGPARLGGFKNTLSFKEQYDEYYIRLTDILTAANGWEGIMAYRTLTAQAKFYLQDGTAWTQNWTQGNLGFNGIAAGATASGRLWLAHNLTNDNGMYGLADSAKEPSVGIPLTDNPDSLVVQPSGDHKKGKNKDGYPPLTNWNGSNANVAYWWPPAETDVDKIGDQVAAGSIVGEDMQGWFCGFIDLCELRFEGPGR